MTRRLVAAIAAVLALFAGLAVAAAPFGLAIQRSGHWSRPTLVNVITGGGVALVGLLGFLFAVAGLVSHLRRRGLLTPDPPPPPTRRTPPPTSAATPPNPRPAPAPAPPSPTHGGTAQPASPTYGNAMPAGTTTTGPAATGTPPAGPAATGTPPAVAPLTGTPLAGMATNGPAPGSGTTGGYVRVAGERSGPDFPRRPEMPRDGALGSEWDGFLQARPTASPADLIQGVRTARDQPSLATPPPGSEGSRAGARPYIGGPYHVERAPSAGSSQRLDDGGAEDDPAGQPAAAEDDPADQAVAAGDDPAGQSAAGEGDPAGREEASREEASREERGAGEAKPEVDGER